MATKIIIADDHPIVRQGIKENLSRENQFEIVSEFEDGASLLQSSELNNVDLIILDLNLPRMDGMEVLKEIKSKNLQTKIIVLTAYKSQKLAEECRELGASAYLVKTQDLSQLNELIIKVVNDEFIYDDFEQLSNEIEDKFSYFDEFLVKYKLTKREVEIIKLISKGYTSPEIAEQLSVSKFTIFTHRKNIFKKLSLDQSNKIGLMNFATENGIV